MNLYNRYIVKRKKYGFILCLPIDEIIGSYSLSDPIFKIMETRCKFSQFQNSRWFHFSGMNYNFFQDSLYFKFNSPVSIFPEIIEGQEYPRYYYEKARSKFPFLFVDTNPLLYIKF